ncbi:MAG: site-specific tyrosine recombinase/integron integrase [Cuniculiplasma sp.]
MVRHMDAKHESLLDDMREKLVADRRSPATVREYLFLSRLFLQFTNKHPNECSEKDIEKFKFFLATEKNYSKGSQYLAIKAVRCMYRVLGVDIPKNLVPPRRARKIPVYLNGSEISVLLDASKDDTTLNSMVNLLIYTGMRVSEMCSLRTDSVDLASGSIRIENGKGDKERIVLIPENVSGILKKYMEWRIEKGRVGDFLFLSRKKGKYSTVSVERMIRELSREAGINRKVTPHTLRHTFATTILKNGGDIRFIQKLLGHSSIGTTEIYTHIDDETMRDMYSRFRPRF